MGAEKVHEYIQISLQEMGKSYTGKIDISGGKI